MIDMLKRVFYGVYGGKPLAVRLDSDGVVLARQAVDTLLSSTADASTSSQTLISGPAELLSISNPTANTLNIYDGATLIYSLPPLLQLPVPLILTTSLIVQSLGVAPTGTITALYRAVS